MRSSPAVSGTSLALASALAFGLSTPLVQVLVRRAAVGPFTTAMLLYAGAAVVGWSTRSKREAPLRREHFGRLLGVAVVGAVVAPTCLAWGLARTSGTSSSLMLNVEALFTIALARLLYREHLGRRVVIAAAALLVGGVLLVLDRGGSSSARGEVSVVGLAAVLAASLAWSVDSAVQKPLSAIDPASVVAAKGTLGAVLSLLLGLVAHRFGRGLEETPSAATALGLVLVGALGYGASLRLYLLAQRAIGAGRTASVFASGPFWGAGLAWVLGEPASILTLTSALVMALGLALHLTEEHGHVHVHEEVLHEHAHRHDDGHHDHVHDFGSDVPATGEHTHPHRHDRVTHAHAHLPDLHHTHDHPESGS